MPSRRQLGRVRKLLDVAASRPLGVAADAGPTYRELRHLYSPGRDSVEDVQQEPELGASQPVPSPPLSPFDRAARNAPCPCGSGKKFKYCHEREVASSTEG